MSAKSLSLYAGFSVVLILALVLGACGGATPPPAQEPTEAVEVPPTEAAPPTEAPPVENVITYVYPRTLNELDPSLVLSSENNVLFNVYGNLTLWDPDEGVVPYLAESWESNEDSSEWTFHLREGLKCHDGTDFTAEDVKFSYDRTIEKGALAYVFAMVNEVVVVDPQTVTVKLKYPFRMDANAANSWGTYMMCRGVADKTPEWFAAGNEIGVGPYRIESFEPGVRMVLTAFEDWWAGWKPEQYTTVVINMVEDPAVRVQMLRGGEADIAWGIPFDDFETINAGGEVTAMAVPAFQQLTWHLNTRRAPLDDVRVRQAISYAFPYEDVQVGTFGGFGVIAKGGVPRLQWQPPVETKVYSYDLDKARELLNAAGVAEGTKIRLGVEVNMTEGVRAAQLWQAELAKLGIDLVIDQITAAVRWDEVYNPETEFNIMVMHMMIGFDSPNEFLGSLFHDGWTWYPFSGYSSPEFNALVEDALSLEATDKDASDRAYQQAEQLLFDNAVAVFALDAPQDFAVRNNVEGFKVNPLYGYDVFFWELSRKP